MSEKQITLQTEFERSDISKLPKPYSKDSEKGKCEECGQWHGLPALHLEYVGHAAVTKRLLDVDPDWYWEPFSIGEDGLPQLDQHGGLWIRLTVSGVTRIGYGDAAGKNGPNAVKEAIGDAIRNAAMRFGVALSLWHKGELSSPVEPAPENWKQLIESASDLPGLTSLYERAEDAGWLTADVRKVFTLRKKELADAGK